MKIQFRSDELIIFESALFRTTTSLIIGKSYLMLVDPNWLPIELDFITETILSVGKGKEKYLLFTHSDYDHIIGYGKFKDYKTIASENFVNNISKNEVLKDITKFDDAYYIKRTYVVEYPIIEIVISGEYEKLTIGSDEYSFYQARGHNADGLLIHNTTKGILLAGDYLSNVEFPYIYDSVDNYLATLSKFERIMNEKQVSLLISGHGDYTSHKAEMMTRIKKSRAYITQLIESVTLDKAFDVEALLGGYEFPIIMKEFHLKNLKLAGKEFRT